jgi:NADPH-dependent 2,4-dienoyl-CoA reductase/sulfur reductase-like enzyme
MTSKVDGTNRQQFPETPAVLIAGAGPTGLMLAAELALARVDVAHR